MTAAHDIIKLRRVTELKNSRAVKTISSRMHTEEDSDVRLQRDVHLAPFLTQEETCTNIRLSLDGFLSIQSITQVSFCCHQVKDMQANYVNNIKNNNNTIIMLIDILMEKTVFVKKKTPNKTLIIINEK